MHYLLFFEFFRAYGKRSFPRYTKLFREYGPACGVNLLSGHILSTNLTELVEQVLLFFLSKICFFLNWKKFIFFVRNQRGSGPNQHFFEHIPFSRFSRITKIIIKDEIYGDVVYNFHYLRENEMQQFTDQDENGRVFAVHFTTYTTEGSKYVPWMKKQLIAKGVRFIRRQINTVRDVSFSF